VKSRVLLSPWEICIPAVVLVLGARSAVAQTPRQVPESTSTGFVVATQPKLPALDEPYRTKSLVNQSTDQHMGGQFDRPSAQSITTRLLSSLRSLPQPQEDQSDLAEPDPATSQAEPTLYTRAALVSSTQASDLKPFSQAQPAAVSLASQDFAVGTNEVNAAELGDRYQLSNQRAIMTLPLMTASLVQNKSPSPLLTLISTKQTDAQDKPSSPSASPNDADKPKLQVNQVIITGNTAISDAEVQQVVEPLVGQQVGFAQLQEASDRITQIYLDRGFITSRAVLLEQTPEDAQAGVVRIQVVEGQLDRIEISGTRRIRPDYIRRRLALAATVPLRQDRLEDQLRLLRADPLFQNIEASLRAGDKVGQSILTVQVEEANPFVTLLNIDNYSPPRVGSERYGISLLHRNLTGRGDQISGSFSTSSTTGSNLFDFGYRIPLNPMNGTLSVRVAPSYYRITDRDFVAFNVRGSTDLYEVTYRQPLLRTPREEFALSIGFTYQTGQTFLFDRPTAFGIGPDPNTGISTTSVLRFSQDYLRRDVRGAWALRSQFNLGLGILGATSNPAPIPDGQFISWLGQVQRVQLLSANHILIAQADLQLAFNTLLPSQQFVIGGGQSVRGFRQNARSADNGFRFSIEDRITVQRDDSGDPLLQIVPFFDMGAVWNTGGNPNVLATNQNFLAGVGLGVIWQPLPRFIVRLEYAYPLMNLVDRTNNVQDAAFYFSINYQP